MESPMPTSLNESIADGANFHEHETPATIQSEHLNVETETTIQSPNIENGLVKSQPSNCSIITVSSDGGGQDIVTETENNFTRDDSMDITIFDHTILPSSQESQINLSKCDANISLLATPFKKDSGKIFSFIFLFVL